MHPPSFVCVVKSLLIEVKLLLESVYTSACVNKLLLACKERVALGADFYLDVRLCGTSFDYVTASALDSSSLVAGMDTFLHVVTAFSFFV